MLIKRKPKISWLINFLGILLLCFLIANSILGSIYITHLKNKMLQITDNYVLAERKLQMAVDSFFQTRMTLFDYNLALQNNLKEEELNKIKDSIFARYRKNEVNLSSLLMNLSKQEGNGPLKGVISELFTQMNEYLLKQENIMSEKKVIDSSQLKKFIEETSGIFIQMKVNMDVLSENFRQRSFEVKNRDNFLAHYFPPVLLVSFFIALIIGGGFIYVSRREVRKSVLDNTAQALSEAYQYQKDCIQTLEICRELMNSSVYTARRNLHDRELTSLENSLKKLKTMD